MTARDHDAVRRDLGVYVLGALDPAERDRFEQHLSQCPECRDEVASLAVLPGLLRRLEPWEAQAADAARDEPLQVDGVVARLAAERRRSRLRDRVLTAAAAVVALVAAVTVVAPPQLGTGGDSVPYVADVEGVTATVQQRAWGMTVRIEAEALPRRRGYVAVAVARDGHRAQVASWSHTGRPVTVEGACYLPPEEVTSLEILAALEREVLTVLHAESS